MSKLLWDSSHQAQYFLEIEAVTKTDSKKRHTWVKMGLRKVKSEKENRWMRLNEAQSHVP
jgi:hypothetical protein